MYWRKSRSKSAPRAASSSASLFRGEHPGHVHGLPGHRKSAVGQPAAHDGDLIGLRVDDSGTQGPDRGAGPVGRRETGHDQRLRMMRDHVRHEADIGLVRVPEAGLGARPVDGLEFGHTRRVRPHGCVGWAAARASARLDRCEQSDEQNGRVLHAWPRGLVGSRGCHASDMPAEACRSAVRMQLWMVSRRSATGAGNLSGGTLAAGDPASSGRAGLPPRPARRAGARRSGRHPQPAPPRRRGDSAVPAAVRRVR